jgi:nitrogen regulatory protein P-II 1
MNVYSPSTLYIMCVLTINISQLKKVEAEVRQERFAEVDSALKRIGVPGLTIAEEKTVERGVWSYPTEHVKRVLLTVVVDDSAVKRVVESIQKSASTTSWGDGRIVVSKLEDVFDIGSRRSDGSELTFPSLSA